VAKKLPYQKLILPNGLTIFLVNIKTVKTFYATLYIKIGAVNESKKNNGISHFLEHLVHQGTENYKSFKLFSEAIEFEGMFQNARTSKLNTYYWVNSPSEKGEKALDLLYELVFLSTLPKSRVDHVRQIILNEYFDYWSEPKTQFEQKTFLKRTKDRNIYQYDFLGKPETIKSFTREELLNWKNKYYQPANMILSVAGNFDQKKIMTKIRNSFGKQKTIKEIKELPRPKITYSDFLIYHQRGESNQISFLLSFPSFGIREVETKKNPQIGLLRFIVGDSYYSRLFKLLREDNNLVYFINSDTPSFPFMGEFIIRGSTAKENLLQSMKLMREELEKIKKNGANKKEMQKARNLYQRNVVCFNFETPQQIANWVVGEELSGKKIRLPDDYMKIVEATSIEEINCLAKDIFDFSKINIGLMGNLKNEEIKTIMSAFKNKKGREN